MCNLEILGNGPSIESQVSCLRNIFCGIGGPDERTLLQLSQNDSQATGVYALPNTSKLTKLFGGDNDAFHQLCDKFEGGNFQTGTHLNRLLDFGELIPTSSYKQVIDRVREEQGNPDILIVQGCTPRPGGIPGKKVAGLGVVDIGFIILTHLWLLDNLHPFKNKATTFACKGDVFKTGEQHSHLRVPIWRINKGKVEVGVADATSPLLTPLGLVVDRQQTLALAS